MIKTGITAWAEPTLIKSGWYPRGSSTPEARLRFYASRFPVVENDAAYYALPERANVEAWSRRTPDGFTMDVKAHALLTGHYTAPARLPVEIRAALPRAVAARARIYPRQVGPELMQEITRRYYDALAPLAASGKLGMVLFQFPVWFPFSRANLEELARIGHAFAPYRVAVELRNASWLSPRNRAQTLDWLAAHRLVYTCVDEPQGFISSVPPIVAATSDLGVVRMHGRNRARWETASRTAAERFDYLYSNDELRAWVPEVMSLAGRTREVHVLFNNCHSDYAVRNAAEMIELLDEARAPANP
jgi:uncharacterized protein YecE (DUF72 family)